MNEFVQRIVAELKSNKAVNSEPLVKMLVESTEKSIKLGENINSVYKKLRDGLVAITETSNNANLAVLVHQFKVNEESLDSQVTKIAKGANLTARIKAIKESNAYVNPVIKTQVDAFESSVNAGTPDFSLCESFINIFSNYQYDSAIKKAVAQVNRYLAENQSTLAMLNTIYRLEMMRTPVYAGVNNNLKTMLVAESYSADSLKMMYANTVPAVTSLINDLAIIESKSTGTFTIGEGNYDTRVNNLITPAIQTADGMLLYTDNRFLSIREAKGLLGNESRIHVDEKFKIADVDPTHVKQKYGNFYDLCEAYATLGFAKTEDGLGVESNSIRNFALGFKVNEKKAIDLYINGVKMGEPGVANKLLELQGGNWLISEALALAPNTTKAKVNLLIEGAKNLFNFEFIKEVSNDRLMTECTLLNLNGSYFICEKVNVADRVWHRVNEHEMYEFFKTKFNYDISPIFKTKIDEGEAALRNIEEAKAAIAGDIAKLEQACSKMTEAIEKRGLDQEQIKKLHPIKDAIEENINGLKAEYIRIDLLKKK
jgi:hypothetical protein